MICAPAGFNYNSSTRLINPELELESPAYDTLLLDRLDDSLSLPDSLTDGSGLIWLVFMMAEVITLPGKFTFICSVPEGFIPSAVLFNHHMLCFRQVWVSMCQRASCLLAFTPTNHIGRWFHWRVPLVRRCANQRWSHLLEWNPVNAQSYTANDCPFRSSYQGTRTDWFLLMTEKIGVFFFLFN